MQGVDEELCVAAQICQRLLLTWFGNSNKNYRLTATDAVTTQNVDIDWKRQLKYNQGVNVDQLVCTLTRICDAMDVQE
jgi:hypothetical protein